MGGGGVGVRSVFSVGVGGVGGVEARRSEVRGAGGVGGGGGVQGARAGAVSRLDEVREASEHRLHRLLVCGREHGALLDEVGREVDTRAVRVVLHAGCGEDSLELSQQVEVPHTLVVRRVDIPQREHLHLTLVERHGARGHERRAELARAHVPRAERVEVREELGHANAASEDRLLEQLDDGLRVLRHVRVLGHRQPLGSARHRAHHGGSVHHASVELQRVGTLERSTLVK